MSDLHLLKLPISLTFDSELFRLLVANQADSRSISTLYAVSSLCTYSSDASHQNGALSPDLKALFLSLSSSLTSSFIQGFWLGNSQMCLSTVMVLSQCWMEWSIVEVDTSSSGARKCPSM